MGADLAAFAPLRDVAEHLGFAQVEAGDIILLSLGEVYAEASIPVRKKIVASRILRVPLIRFLDRLKGEFGNEAEHQLATAVAWGRFAALLAYDKGSDELYLEAE